MNMHEYMLLTDGSVIPFQEGIPTAHQISDALIKYKGVAYYWPGTVKSLVNEGVWYVILPVFENPGGTVIAYERMPDVIKFAIILS